MVGAISYGVTCFEFLYSKETKKKVFMKIFNSDRCMAVLLYYVLQDELSSLFHFIRKCKRKIYVCGRHNAYSY